MSLSPDQILKLQARTPRYTSYPTAPVWRSDIPPQVEAEALGRVSSPASVYVHLPFCAEQCSFCACHQVVSGRREAGDRYLHALARQIETLPLPQEPVTVERIHLGGGTPTWYGDEDLDTLLTALRRRLRFPGPDEQGHGELDVEVDPEITTDAQVDGLAHLGATRISMGVQSFDPGVLEAVGRPQRSERIGAILERAHSHGMRGLNMDLMYGLPRQLPEVFARDLDQTIALKPDRLAIFGYAHVPWLKPHQKRLEAYGLPSAELRLELFYMAHERMRAAGYVPIGFDHFARPQDELAIAAREGRLHRNFMGYTTRPDLELVGLGMSAISDLKDSYFQQLTKLGDWWKAAEQGQPTLEKALLLSPEDKLRRDVINRIMCNLSIRWADVAARWGIDPKEHFALAWERLKPLQDLGLCTMTDEALEVTEDGRVLVRNIASAFDAYLAAPGEQTSPRFSQAI